MNQWCSLESNGSIWDAMKWAQIALEEKGRPDAQIDAKLLMLYITGFNETQLLLRRQEGLCPEYARRYNELIYQRAEGIPLQHLTGEQEFMGLTFKVNAHVLIPRQDTEVLIEHIIEKGKGFPCESGIDIGTGSGCIGISLAYYMPKLSMTLVDVSPEALEVAQENVMRHQLQDRIELLESNLLTHYTGEKVDLIVSNPPYIAKEAMVDLMIEVKDHEPRLALTDEGDGLYFYKQISSVAKNYLRVGGLLAYEIGHDQSVAVCTILEEEGYTEIERYKDLSGNDRVVLARYNEKI